MHLYFLHLTDDKMKKKMCFTHQWGTPRSYFYCSVISWSLQAWCLVFDFFLVFLFKGKSNKVIYFWKGRWQFVLFVWVRAIFRKILGCSWNLKFPNHQHQHHLAYSPEMQLSGKSTWSESLPVDCCPRRIKPVNHWSRTTV